MRWLCSSIRRDITFTRITFSHHSSNINIVYLRDYNVTFVSVYLLHPLIQEFSSLILPPYSSDYPGRLYCLSHIMNLCFLCSSEFLCDLNDGSFTHKITPNQNPSVSDLAFSSPSLASYLSWFILPYLYGRINQDPACLTGTSATPVAIPSFKIHSTTSCLK